MLLLIQISLTWVCAEISEKKIRLKHHISRTEKCCESEDPAQNNAQVSEGGITVKPGQDYSIHELIISHYLKSEPVCRFSNLLPVSNCIQMIGEFLTATFKYTMRWKIFQWMKFLFRHSSNSRKLSLQKFYNELACVFTAHLCAISKNAD